MPVAYLMVRAVVADPADRAPFDQWYRAEHLADALKVFGAVSAMRGWSEQDPSVHFAFYRFEDAQDAHSLADRPGFQTMIEVVDRRWGARVTRTRVNVVIADEIKG